MCIALISRGSLYIAEFRRVLREIAPDFIDSFSKCIRK
jgi:hypothetical protein